MSYILAMRIRNDKIEKGIAAANKAGISDMADADKLVADKWAAYRATDCKDEKARILYLWALKVQLGCRAINRLPIGRI